MWVTSSHIRCYSVLVHVLYSSLRFGYLVSPILRWPSLRWKVSLHVIPNLSIQKRYPLHPIVVPVKKVVIEYRWDCIHSRLQTVWPQCTYAFSFTVSQAEPQESALNKDAPREDDAEAVELLTFLANASTSTSPTGTHKRKEGAHLHGRSVFQCHFFTTMNAIWCATHFDPSRFRCFWGIVYLIKFSLWSSRRWTRSGNRCRIQQ